MVESDKEEILTSEKGMKENLLPTGRKLGVVPVKGFSMYKIAYVDGKGGEIPAQYASNFTTLTYATRELKRFLFDLWAVSDKVSSKRKTISLNQDNAIS